MSWGRYVDQPVRIEWRDDFAPDGDYLVLCVIDPRHGVAVMQDASGKQFPADWTDVKRITREGFDG